MVLSVSTVAPTLRLTTRAAVKAELGITATTDDALFDTLIDQYSSAIVAYCHRPFARETYAEQLPGFSDIHLQLERTPVVAVTAMTICGQVITDYGIENADRGWLFSRAFSGSGNTWDRVQFPWSAMRYAGLSAGGAWLDQGIPLDRQEEPTVAVSYTAGYILPSQYLSAVTTVSAATSDDSFIDSASGFPALLTAGDIVETSGFVNAANNARFLVTGTPTTAKITISGNLTTEAAGATVTVKFRPPSIHRPFDDVEKACIEAVKGGYLQRAADPSLIEKQAGPMRLRYSENRGAEGAGLPPTCVGLLRPWVRAA
jgi:hypothetical protein